MDVVDAEGLDAGAVGEERTKGKQENGDSRFRITVRAHFWIVPISASIVDATLKFCKGSFHGKQEHDKYQGSTATHEIL